MAITKHAFISFFDLTGGINTVASAIRLKPTEARDAQDIDYFPIGGVSKRNGFLPLNTTPFNSSAVTGLYMARYTLNGGTNLAIAIIGNKIATQAGALGGPWTDSTNGLTITAAANDIWQFDILNDICVGGNGIDTPIQINSSATATTGLSGSPPFSTYRFPIQTRGYMWYFVPTVSGTVNYDRGYFSNINDPITVGTNNFVDVGKGQGGIVTGAVDYKTYLFVFKRSGIFQINYQPTRVDSTGTLFPFNQTPNPIVPGVGTQSHRSIVKFTTPETHATPGQELVFFVDQFGIPRIFDGMTTISFASKIGSSRDTTILSLTNMDTTRTSFAFSINYPSKSKILFFLSKLNSQQDTCWVLDYTTGFSIGRYKYSSAFNCGALFEKSDGTFKPYLGDYAGTVHQADQGTNDNGQPINDYYVTGDTFIKSPAIQNNWFECEVRGINGSTNQGTKISYYINGQDTPASTDTVVLASIQTLWGASQPMIWGVSQWSKQGVATSTSEVHQVSKTLRVKVESLNKLTDSMILEGFTLSGEPLGTIQS